MKVERTQTGPIYTVDKDGAIEINSIKNKSIFDYAKKCDKNGNNILETNELPEFLSKYGKVKDNNMYSVYYEQKDRDGNLMKKCFLMKSDNTQLRYTYKNGKPYICVMTMSDGKRVVMHFEKRQAIYYENANEPKKYERFSLDDQNIENYTNIGLEKVNTSQNESFLQGIIRKLKSWHL